MQRKSFTFYRSFYEALCYLPEEHRLPAFMAICAYALDGEEPQIEGVRERSLRSFGPIWTPA